MKLGTALVYRYKHDYLEVRVTTWAFSTTAIISSLPKAYGLFRHGLLDYRTNHQFPVMEKASNITIKQLVIPTK